MHETNKTVLLKANEAIGRLDFDGFLEHCTEDTEWVFVGDRTLRGRAAVKQWMIETYQQPPVVTVERLIAVDDDLVAMGEITVMPPGGAGKPQAYCDVWKFRNGKLHQLRAFVVAPQ